MEFAISRPSADLKQSLVKWLSSATENRALVWGLLDGSMFERYQLEEFIKANSAPVSILSDTPLDSYGIHGPLLWEIPQPEVLSRLITFSGGKPALSLISTRNDIETLRSVLQWLAVAETEDGQRLYCRYADTRVLPGLLGLLNDEQRHALGIGMESWAWCGRDGIRLGESSLPSPPDQASSAELPEIFSLDAAQYSGLLQLAEPDMVCQMLAERMPELIGGKLSGEFHGRIARILEQARHRGVSELSDLFQFAVLALTTYDDFARHPLLTDLWEQYAKQKTPFGEWAESWPEDIWPEMERAARAEQGK